jgi:hypothetical protein
VDIKTLAAMLDHYIISLTTVNKCSTKSGRLVVLEFVFQNYSEETTFLTVPML